MSSHVVLTSTLQHDPRHLLSFGLRTSELAAYNGQGDISVDMFSSIDTHSLFAARTQQLLLPFYLIILNSFPCSSVNLLSL